MRRWFSFVCSFAGIVAFMWSIGVFIYSPYNLDLPMVYVQGGTFQMGCAGEIDIDCESNEQPIRKVTLSSFYIGQYEVTQQQWRSVMGSNPSFFSGCDNCPVEKITWKETQLFLKKLNSLTKGKYRLPTEAEWEYAARGGSISKGYIYSGSNQLGEVAWNNPNSGDKTGFVGRKKPNELGIFDMSGNVWEYCSDWYMGYSFEDEINPTGPREGFDRIIRGGSYFSTKNLCRVVNRGKANLDVASEQTGLRLAQNVLF